MPLAGGQLGDISVSLQGRQLIVRARRHDLAGGSAPHAPGSTDELERTLILPELAEVTAVEARVTGGVLHVRVGLRTVTR
jgi:HSP20 family molecular chaperone IbpA